MSLDVLHSVSCGGFACSRVPEGPRARVLGGCGGFSPPARGGAGEEKECAVRQVSGARSGSAKASYIGKQAWLVAHGTASRRSRNGEPSLSMEGRASFAGGGGPPARCTCETARTTTPGARPDYNSGISLPCRTSDGPRWAWGIVLVCGAWRLLVHGQAAHRKTSTGALAPDFQHMTKGR